MQKDHKQGSTIECLSEHVRNLTKECHLQTLRVAELQVRRLRFYLLFFGQLSFSNLKADDYHLDRPLFLACRDDRERFCRNAQAGQGRVYKCLIKNKMQNDMSTKVLPTSLFLDEVKVTNPISCSVIVSGKIGSSTTTGFRRLQSQQRSG